MNFFNLIVLVLAGAATVTCQGQKEIGGTEEKEETVLSPRAFQSKVAEINGRLLDVRTPEEYKGGHIEGSENINFFDENFQDKVKALPKDETYFVYCRSGGRSGKACTMMQEAGFEKVYDLDGGMLAWEKESLPVKKDE